MSLRRGIVVETHPEDHSVDLVMADNGQRLIGVQVMSPSASTRTGRVDMPEIKPTGDKWDISKPTGQDMIAMVGDFGGHPVVQGFLYPQVNQMLFKDPKLRVDRHQSDVLSSIDGDGNIQLVHPSGMYIRIGEAPDKADLSNQNADSSLAADRNTGRRVHVRLSLAGKTVELTMTPDGDVTLELNQNLVVKAKQNVNIVADGNIDIHAKGNMHLKADGTMLSESGGDNTIKGANVHLNP